MSDQNNQVSDFSWIKFYEELADKLFEYKDKRAELITKLELCLNKFNEISLQNSNRKAKTISVEDFCYTDLQDGNLSDIDPFTVFAIFNRAQTYETKKNFFESFKTAFGMISDIPSSTDGVPHADNRRARFFNSPNDIEKLWNIFVAAINLSNGRTEDDSSFSNSFDSAEKINNVKWNLTFALYWIRPNFFLPLDSNSRNFISINPKYLVSKEISDYFSRKSYDVPSGEKYLSFCRKLFSSSNNSDFSIPVLSHRAYLLAQENLNVWKVSLGKDFFDDQKFNEYVSKRLVSVAKNTGKNQGEQYLNEFNKGHIFYLCNGSNQIRLLGRVLEDEGSVDPNDEKWVTKKYEILKESIDKTKCNVGKKWWQPNGNSTIRKIDTNELKEFESTILSPFFNLSIDDLMEMSKKPIGYYEKYEMNNLESKIISQLKLSKNVILHGAPGTGKTYIATKRIPLLMEAETIDFVQFHPSYDYTDFVEGLRPVSKVEGDNSTVCFERKNGTFYSFCENALKAFKADEKQDKKRKFIFIIDEINRGELSKIFGELFFCIDPGYRGVDGAIKTQYENLHQEENEFDKFLHDLDKQHSNEEENSDPSYKNHEGNGWFFVPENVYIIGTMNDVDRSVESMDIAFRRRFSFIEINAEDTRYMLDECDEKKVNSAAWNSILDSVKDKMNALNKAILDIANLSCDYQIGASYFMKLQDLQDDGSEDNFALLWKYHLEGLIKEYLRGEPNAEAVIKKLKDAYDEPELILKDQKIKAEERQSATGAEDEKSSNDSEIK